MNREKLEQTLGKSGWKPGESKLRVRYCGSIGEGGKIVDYGLKESGGEETGDVSFAEFKLPPFGSTNMVEIDYGAFWDSVVRGGATLIIRYGNGVECTMWSDEDDNKEFNYGPGCRIQWVAGENGATILNTSVPAFVETMERIVK
jgi:hypothetical protein